MTKLNWERANSSSRLQRQTSTGNQYEDGPENEVYDLNNLSHNPLGLRPEDLDGRILDIEKRLAIVKHLIKNDDAIRRHYRLEYFEAPDTKFHAKNLPRSATILFSRHKTGRTIAVQYTTP